MGGEYKGPSTEANPQECVNLIVELDRNGGLDSLSIRPGLTELADLTDEETQDEILSNGEFDSDTAWDKGTGWTISDGVLTHATGTASTVTQDSEDMDGSISEGVTYRLTFTVSGYNGGYITPQVGGASGVSVNANGDYSMDVVSGSGADFVFYASAAFSGNIDDVSLKEIVFPQVEIRGLHIMGNYLYAVHGDQLKQIDSAYSSTTLTDSTNKLSTKTGPVTMAHINNASDGLQLMICDGSDGVAYIYDTTTSLFTRLTTAEHSFYGGGSVTAQDSMFISHRPDTPEFYISATQDGLTWDILDVHTAEAKTSNIARVLSAFQKLWVTKGDSTEEFYDSGSDPVWQRSSLALIELGTLAPDSWALVDNSLLWLAHDKTVRQSRGSADAQIVSTYHISRTIEKMSDATDAIGYGFVQNNHSYYVLTFPSADKTFVYDLSNGVWCSWASMIEDGSKDDGRFRGNCYAEFNKMDVVGDYKNNKLYKVDQETFADAGNRIRRTRVFALPKNENKNLFMHEFELDVNTGSGIDSGQGSDPQAMLQISRNGGKTYGRELWAAIGASGEYEYRARWFQLGKAREPVFKVTISDPFQDVWVGAYLESEQGYA